jgi:uncharacterized protein YjbJ (UPF0337 family)
MAALLPPERNTAMGANEERMKGAGEELKGKVKNAAGDLLDNEQMQAEGRADELKGQARQKANQ